MIKLFFTILCFIFPCFGSAQSQLPLSDSSLLAKQEALIIRRLHGPSETKEVVAPQGMISERRAVQFGAKAGMNLSAMNFNKGYPPLTIPAENSWKPGFAFGVFMEVPLSDKFSIQQDYMFSHIKGEDQGISTSFAFNYLSLPVLFKYSFLPRFSFVAGPQFELLLQARETANGQTSIVTRDTEERNIGLTGGMEWLVNKRMRLNARYMHGLNHVGIGQRSAIKEFKYEVVQIFADYLF